MPATGVSMVRIRAEYPASLARWTAPRRDVASAAQVELKPRRAIGRGLDLFEPACPTASRGSKSCRPLPATRSRDLLAPRPEHPAAADRRQDRSGSAMRRPEDCRRQIGRRRVDRAARAEADVLEGADVLAERDFSVGAAVDVVEHGPRQPPPRRATEILDVDECHGTDSLMAELGAGGWKTRGAPTPHLQPPSMMSAVPWIQVYDPLGGAVAEYRRRGAADRAAAGRARSARMARAPRGARSAWWPRSPCRSSCSGCRCATAAATAVYGAAYGFLPIGWIVLNAVFLYSLTVATGQFEILKSSVGRLSADRRIQALLVAFSFGAFIEGASGFGTPVAICSALLIGLGFTPLYAAGLVAHRQHRAGRLRRDRHADPHARRRHRHPGDDDRHDGRTAAPVRVADRPGVAGRDDERLARACGRCGRPSLVCGGTFAARPVCVEQLRRRRARRHRRRARVDRRARRSSAASGSRRRLGVRGGRRSRPLPASGRRPGAGARTAEPASDAASRHSRVDAVGVPQRRGYRLGAHAGYESRPERRPVAAGTRVEGADAAPHGVPRLSSRDRAGGSRADRRPSVSQGTRRSRGVLAQLGVRHRARRSCSRRSSARSTCACRWRCSSPSPPRRSRRMRRAARDDHADDGARIRHALRRHRRDAGPRLHADRRGSTRSSRRCSAGSAWR